jgi:hypothetical protein
MHQSLVYHLSNRTPRHRSPLGVPASERKLTTIIHDKHTKDQPVRHVPIAGWKFGMYNEGGRQIGTVGLVKSIGRAPKAVRGTVGWRGGELLYKAIRATLLRVDMHFVRQPLVVMQIAIVVFLLVVYQSSLLPGVGCSGDTAKFQFLGKVLGTPHATGYPTYVILNHLFVNLYPFGELAYRANLLSALLTVVSVLILCRILLLLQIDPAIASIASASFGVTYTLWSQSIVAEV